MLFNSLEFLFAFLPACVIIYFLMTSWRMVVAARAFLVVASLFFYAWWDIAYLPIIMVSMLANFAVGTRLQGLEKHRKKVLTVGITLNLAALAWFKYVDFFIGTANAVAGTHFPMQEIVLPLAISFFTFQQIAFLVDAYRREVKEMDFLNYCLFVTFFPQLIAGPIVHHKQMMPQFARTRNAVLQWPNIALGLFIFSIGLFKKIVVADTFAVWAAKGFDHQEVLGFFEAWATSLSYTFQLYYDFSGYADMAIGAALMFNIRLPENFNSPYKSLSIQEFWRRWHMTLSQWLRDYLYIPLGGNRYGFSRQQLNMFITMLLGGLWHGAAWTFVLWGAAHGVALAIHRYWARFGIVMPALLAWFLTFMFVNATWVLFRAKEFDDAIKVYKGMLGLNGYAVTGKFARSINDLVGSEWLAATARAKSFLAVDVLPWLVVAALVAFFAPNARELGERYRRPGVLILLFCIGVWIYAWQATVSNAPSEFLYFNF